MEIHYEDRDQQVRQLQEALGEGVLDELLQRSFPNRTALHVRALTPGISGAAVLHVQPEQNGAQHSCVVKIGHSEDIGSEYARWVQFVQPFLSHGEMPDVMSGPIESGAGQSALVYKFYARRTLTNLIQSLSKAQDARGIDRVLRNLIDILRAWHQNRHSTFLDLVRSEYKISDEQFSQFESFCGQENRWAQIRRTEVVREVWNDPPESVRDAQSVATSHGDLHANNVLVDPDGRLGVIDFLHTGPHHFLRDYATLEADLLLRVLSPTDATVAEAREVLGILSAYYSPDAFTDVARHRFLEVGEHLAMQNTLRTLRAAIWGRMENDPRQLPGYHVAVMWRMLKMTVRPDSGLSDFQRWLGANLTIRQARIVAGISPHAIGDGLSAGGPVVHSLPSGAISRIDEAFLELESRAEMAVGQLNRAWVASPVSPLEVRLSEVASALADDPLPDSPLVAEIFTALVNSHPDRIRYSDLPAGFIQKPPDAIAFDINQRLRKLPANTLSEFRVSAVAGVDGVVALGISEVDVSSLLSRQPHDPIAMDPALKAAWNFYETGVYSSSLARFLKVAQNIGDGRTFTRSELALFFYYFSKCLLKLNMYEALQRCIDGPYREFSAALCPELEAERQQIAGILYRQQGDSGLAQLCLDESCRQLAALAEGEHTPEIFRSLADVHVLRAHPSLDQTARARTHLGRDAGFRAAAAAVRQAELMYERYWRESGKSSHYEGRLGGTLAFLTIARSIAHPSEVDAEGWLEAEDQARRGFEPEAERKPVGIVAGRAALAAVKLAKAQWTRATAPENEEEAQRLLSEAAEVLGVVIDDYLAVVELGSRFEYRKLDALSRSINELATDTGATVNPDSMTPLL